MRALGVITSTKVLQCIQKKTTISTQISYRRFTIQKSGHNSFQKSIHTPRMVGHARIAMTPKVIASDGTFNPISNENTSL